MIHARSPLFENRAYDEDSVFFRFPAEPVRDGAGNGFGQFEAFRVFRLAEVSREKKLGKADYLGSEVAGFLHGQRCLFQTFLFTGVSARLGERDSETTHGDTITLKSG